MDPRKIFWMTITMLGLGVSSAHAIQYSANPSVDTYAAGAVIQAKVQALTNGFPGKIRFRMKRVDGANLKAGTAQVRVGSQSGTVWQEWSYGAEPYVTSLTYPLPTDFTSGSKTYYITVKGQPTSAIYSGAMTVMAQQETPNAPSVSATGPTSIQISWSSVSEATEYRLYRSTSAFGTYQQIYWSSGLSYTDSGPHLSPNTTYYYKVRAGDDPVWSNYSSYSTVTTPLDKLPTPLLNSPSDGASNQSKTLMLDWQTVTGATQYRVFVDTSFSKINSLADLDYSCTPSDCLINQVTSSSEYAVPNGILKPGVTYYWRVRAGSANIGSPNSAVRSFTAGTLTNVSPTGGTYPLGGSLPVSWSYFSEPSSVSMTIAIKRDSCGGCSKGGKDWRELTGSTSNDESQSLSIPSDISVGDDWRVYVKDNTTYSDGSEYVVAASGTFKIELAAPSLNGPCGGIGNQSKTATLDWGDVSGASAYRVFIAESSSVLQSLSNNATSCSGCVEPNGGLVSTSSYTVSQGVLKNATTYYWMVHAGSATFASPNSSICSFQTGSITNVQPASGSYDLGKTLPVSWSFSAESMLTNMVISIKRDSCIQGGVETCTEGDKNWRLLTTTTYNDGAEELSIPSDLAPASDWRVYVKEKTTGYFVAATGVLILTKPPVNPPAPIASSPCLGNNYEQVMPVGGVKPPDITAVNYDAVVSEGEKSSMSVAAVVDTAKGGKPFFYWCADQGGFVKDASDYSAVHFVAPAVPGSDEVVEITVQVGDTLGYIDTKTFTVTIQEIGNGTAGDPSPSASIVTPPGSLTEGEVYPISFQVSDQDATGKDTSDALSTDLSVLKDGVETVIVTGLKGKKSSYPWAPQGASTNYQLKLVTTDGNQKTTATSGSFSVVPVAIDSDGDGILDPNDGCPYDINKSSPGVCGCGVSDLDTDGDGTPNCNDACANDPLKTAPGACGCGVADTDSNGDGTADCLQDSDGDGIANNLDPDDDNDGIPDATDNFPFSATKKVYRWLLNDGTGCVASDSENQAMHGALKPLCSTNVPLWTPDGLAGGGLDLDGIDDYVSTPLPYAGQTDYTISAWYQTDVDYLSRMSLVGGNNGGGFEVYLHNGRPGCRIWNNQDRSIFTDEKYTGGWHQVICTQTINPASTSLYVDGELKKTTPYTSVSAGGFWALGRPGSSIAHYYKGILDEVKIWNYPLSTAEVQQEFTSYVVPVDPLPSASLSHHWSLEEGSGCATLSSTGMQSTLAPRCNNGNGPLWSATFAGKGLDLDGIDDYLDTPLAYTNDTDLTVAAWYQSDASTITRMALVGGNSGGRFEVYVDKGRPGCRIWDTADRSIFANENYLGGWHHVACVQTLSPASTALYVDGVLKKTVPYASISAGGNWLIGRPGSSLAHYFNGLVDEIHIEPKALSIAEIADLYSNP